jgi:2,4-dienoyl-CoA reductase-like NADH-dependent reductase (Old Yellow Enzyme family)/thioredoxin reductase
MYDYLFSPIKVRGLELKNRIKLPGMAVCMHERGYVTQRMISFLAARAKGGCGLITTEATSIHAPTAPEDLLNISEDKYIPGMKRLTDAIHNAGSKACLMMVQDGISTFYVDPDLPVFIPSDKPEFGLEGASLDFIKEVVDAHGQSAARAVKAGFDAVELHAAHGYGLHGFLSPGMNKRTDEYGGTPENRARFALECIRAIRANIPDEMPIFVRIVPFDDHVENGLTAEEIIQFCNWAKEAGADALDVSRGNCWGHGAKYVVPPMDLPRGFNIDNAARIKKETGIITVGVGRINDPDQAESYLSEGKLDMVDIGRAQLADADFCIKAQEGRPEDIVRCVGCLIGCFDRCMNPDYPHITCLWNPAVGEEEAYAITKTETPKKVLVAGGGVAGMEAAITLNQRGHKVILAEKNAELGGLFLLAGIAPRKGETLEAVRSRTHHVEKAGVEIRTNTPITQELIDEIAPDVVVFAIGGTPIQLSIPGADRPNVYAYQDVLTDKVSLNGKIAVIGGGLVGIEVAEYIDSKDSSSRITIVEMLKAVGKELGGTRSGYVEEALEEAKIECLTKAKAIEITDQALIVEIKEEQQEIPVDAVVIAVGSRSAAIDELLAFCEGKGIPSFVIGDAQKIGVALDAIASAAEVAREI